MGELPQSWGKRKYSFKFDCIDLLSLDGDLRDIAIDDLLFEFRIALQSTLFHGGMWGRANSKEMKESVEDITKKKRLEDLSIDDFDLLKKTGMLWEFYPDAPETYNEITVMIAKRMRE